MIGNGGPTATLVRLLVHDWYRCPTAALVHDWYGGLTTGPWSAPGAFAGHYAGRRIAPSGRWPTADVSPAAAGPVSGCDPVNMSRKIR